MALFIFVFALSYSKVESNKMREEEGKLTELVIESKISGAFKSEILFLELMSRQWEVNDGIDRNEWSRIAQRAVSDFDLQAVEWVEKTTVKWIVPLKGNEKVPGHNLLEDERPNVRADVQRTIQTREIAISGPYPLRQGGLGIIARQAVFYQDEFWG